MGPKGGSFMFIDKAMGYCDMLIKLLQMIEEKIAYLDADVVEGYNLQIGFEEETDYGTLKININDRNIFAELDNDSQQAFIEGRLDNYTLYRLLKHNLGGDFDA